MDRFSLIKRRDKSKNKNDYVSETNNQDSKKDVIPPADTPKIQSTEQEIIVDETEKKNQSTDESEKVIVQDISEESSSDTQTLPKDTISNTPKEKIACPNCKKTFGRPLLMLDFNGGETKMVMCCPYCYAPFGAQTVPTPVHPTHHQQEGNKLELHVIGENVELDEELNETLESYGYLK